MFLNRMTLIGFTGQESKTFAAPSGKEVTRLAIVSASYQSGVPWKYAGADSEKTIGRPTLFNAALSAAYAAR